MYKKIFLLALTVISFMGMYAQHWSYAAQSENPGGGILTQSWGKTVLTDDYGNYYIEGKYLDSVKIGDTIIISRIPDGSEKHSFLVKYDSNDVLQWIKQFDFSDFGPSSSFKVKMFNDHIYMLTETGVGDTLFYEDTIIYNTQQWYIFKYDLDGHLIHLYDVPRGFRGECYEITDKCIYVGGSQWDTIFTQDSIYPWTYHLIPEKCDNFEGIIQLNHDGSIQSIDLLDVRSNDIDYLEMYEYDNNIFIYIEGGSTADTILLHGDTSLVVNDPRSTFLIKYSEDLKYQWIIPFESSGDVDAVTVHEIEFDDSGNIYMAGRFVNDLYIGGDTLTGYYDLFLAKYDKNGNFLWINSDGNDEAGHEERADNLTINNDGFIYVSGDIRLPVYFDSIYIGYDPESIYGGISTVIFLAKYDNKGNVLWAGAAGNWYAIAGGGAYIYDLKMLNNDKLITTGSFNLYEVKFGDYRMTPVGDRNMFITKFSDCNAVINVMEDKLGLPPAESYEWYANDTLLAGDTNQTIVPDTGITYYGIVTYGNGCVARTHPVTYTEYLPLSCSASINILQDLLELPEAISYQWYANDTLIPGGTDQTIVPDTGVAYYGIVTYSDGCEAKTPPVTYSDTLFDEIPGNKIFENTQVTVFPNPARDILYIKSEKQLEEISMYSITGIKIKEIAINNKNNIRIKLDENISNGFYLLEIKTNEYKAMKKIIIE